MLIKAYNDIAQLRMRNLPECEDKEERKKREDKKERKRREEWELGALNRAKRGHLTHPKSSFSTILHFKSINIHTKNVHSVQHSTKRPRICPSLRLSRRLAAMLSLGNEAAATAATAARGC